MTIRSSYELPEDMTQQSVQKGLIELVRPCSPDITAYFVRLQAFKPFFDTDPLKTGIIYEGLYDDLKDYPEIAVVLGIEDLRRDKSIKWFPTEAIEGKVKDYSECIYDALDYFHGETK